MNPRRAALRDEALIGLSISVPLSALIGYILVDVVSTLVDAGHLFAAGAAAVGLGAMFLVGIAVTGVAVVDLVHALRRPR